jgi:hypothetical protein
LVTYINSIIPSVSTQGQSDSVYFDLTKAFDIVSNNILLRKLSNFGLSSSYVDWFHSYLSNRQSFVRVSGTLSFLNLVKCGVPQGSTQGPLLFNIFINDICDSIHNSQCLLFADNLKIYRSISDVDEYKLLRHDVDSVRSWCIDNGMKLNLGNITVISFTHKKNIIYFNYKLCNNLVSRYQCVKDLGILLDCKLCFHRHIDYMFSQGLKMFGLIRYITSSFSTLDSLLVLYSTLVRSKIECTCCLELNHNY